MTFVTVISEGNLIPADILEQIASGEAVGQAAADFALDSQRRLSDEIAAVWSDARLIWEVFQNGLRRTPEGESTTRLTRERWIGPLLNLLGYSLRFMPSAALVNQRTYAISHRAGADESAPPVHIEGSRSKLDQRPPSGRPRLSPHALLQEYLNATEHLWGLVTNGLRLRLLRDSSRTSRPSFVEFDLEALFGGEKFAEFALLYRLLHRSRLPSHVDDGPSSLLERYHQQALEAGGRVRDGLRDGVHQALEVLGSGFLRHPANFQLRASINDGSLPPQLLYRQLLRLIYRFLFLMVAEERRLIGGPETPMFHTHYSISRLRRMAESHGTGRDRFGDAWLGILTTFRILRDDETASFFNLKALDGDLFGPDALPALEQTQLTNAVLMQAVRALSLYKDPLSGFLRRVNYGALDVEELGSVYESLLDFRPVIDLGASVPFRLVGGTERKTTGSYYTRPELVQELIKSALVPVLEERLRLAGPDPKAREAALLSLTVCDPACGSGHFLLEAARRLGRELARLRSGEDQPAPEQFRLAVREVIAHCVYGVDLNPLAVDLCKLALWLEGFNAGMPLSFLDSHIRWGNSLVGASEALVNQGLPDDVFKPVTGDDKTLAAALRKRNKQERADVARGQLVMDLHSPLAQRVDVAHAARTLDAAPDTSVAEVRAKAANFAALREKLYDTRRRYDVWTAAFFTPFTPDYEPLIPTSRVVETLRRHPASVNGLLIGHAAKLALNLGFFHWDLEFPHVFEQGGFDVILGNPPWERIKLQEQEHWVDVQEIAQAQNKAARDRLLKAWATSSEPAKRARYAQFEQAKYEAEATSRFIRTSARFPLTAVGDVNTYALFSELDRDLTNSTGRTGIIVPTGIATDDSTKAFFGDLIQSQTLVQIVGFENEAFIFPSVHHAFKFCTITITGNQNPASTTDFIFFCRHFDHIQQDERHFTLTKDEINLINPNTLTCPVFRTKADAELTKKIYRRVPILENEHTGQNPWGIKFMTMFHMSNDSHLFKTKPLPDHIPLYEAKMLHQFTHRWATYQGISEEELRKGLARPLSHQEQVDPSSYITPRYWIDRKEVQERLVNRWNRPWLLGFRDITSNVVERTAIFSFLPRVGVGHTMPIIFLENISIIRIICFVTALNSLSFDFITRQKVGGTHLTYSVLNQLPVLPPDTFSASDIGYIVPRVVELVYSAWDMQGFAEDIWSELAPSERERLLERNRDCNRSAPREWFSPRDAFPLPPFQWNDERRAVIRAELDAKIAKLYGLTRDELRYILDPEDVYGPDFPGETFRVLKEKEQRTYGEYRTRRLVLEAWDREEAT